MKKQGDQFEDLVFPGVRRERGGASKTYRGKVPVTPEGHTRLWRSTSFPELQRGDWATRPLTGYGSRMLYMDVPQDHPKLNESLPGTRGEHFNLGWDRSGSRESLPGRPAEVQYTDEKDYESSDYGEYSERWGD